ncbi:MAG: ORF6N domain-containing protein, partial [Anaerolineaceae bacterium]|nr:ORF6N domain-containing protein [Anaerolineaceae bacterium]
MSEKSKDLTEHRIISSILIIRNTKVILDSDLVELYGVETRHLNEQVRLNLS